jgi:hypothetical protein
LSGSSQPFAILNRQNGINAPYCHRRPQTSHPAIRTRNTMSNV